MRLHKLLMQLRMLVKRSQAGAELDNELQFHLDQQIAENLVPGMEPEEARLAALRTFGNKSNARRGRKPLRALLFSSSSALSNVC